MIDVTTSAMALATTCLAVVLPVVHTCHQLIVNILAWMWCCQLSTLATG